MKDLHGTTTGYRYGCRCDRCRGAVAERMRFYRHSKKKPSARQLFKAELAAKNEQATQQETEKVDE